MLPESIEPIDTSTTPLEVTSKIHIRFFGSIRMAAKKSEDELDYLPDTTIYNLMQTLSNIFGKAMSDELIDEKSPDGLREDLMITQNEVIINHGKAHDIKINQGDTIALFPTFLGGG